MFPLIPYSERHKHLKALFARRTTFNADLDATVREIIEKVRIKRDQALYELTDRFDHVQLSTLKVPSEALEEAYKATSSEFKTILRKAAEQIREFHRKQLPNSWFTEERHGVILGQRMVPIERVGLYVPGGKAIYPSSVLMNAIPAQIAGVKELILVSPPGPDKLPHPLIRAAAYFLGIEHVYSIGGAQAIAALAYGTESIPKVDKIVGPGNAYVATAKRMVFGTVAIDAIAGPSEIAVLAEATAPPAYVAADLLSQAEHDERASAILVTPDKSFAESVRDELLAQLPEHPRKHILEQSLRRYSAAIITNSLQEAINTINELAPEHLEILTQNPWETLPHIKHAGAIFLGPYSTEPVGDYMAGPNHVLPTGGTARYASALGVEDFLRRQSIIAYTPERLQEEGPYIMAFAHAEQLPAHAWAIQVRMNTLERSSET